MPFSDGQQKIANLLEKLEPVLIAIGAGLNAIEPYAMQAYTLAMTAWTALAPYHPEELIEALFGIFLAFFGGSYLVTLAAIEAYRLCGWNTTIKYLRIIWDDYQAVRAESRKDDQVDADNDGIADVKQITKHQLFTRKLKLAAKSCNPDKLSMALGGLYTGFMGVVATLRVQFAQTVTLGAVIGGTFSKYAQKVFGPIMDAIVPSEYAKWSPVIIDYICRAIGVSIAWTVQRVISAFYSAVRGAQLTSRGVLSYAARHGYIPGHIYDEGGVHYAMLTFGIAATGFVWQLSNFMQLPFPFNLIFFPITVVEYFLQYFVAFDNLPQH